MNLLVFCLFVAIGVYHVSAMSIPQVKQVGKMMRGSCQPRIGVSKELLDKLQEGEFVDDKKLKCYIKCVMGLMMAMKNNKYNADFAISMARKMLPDDIKERSVAAIDKCRDVGAELEDGCDLAYEVLSCTYNADPEVFMFP